MDDRSILYLVGRSIDDTTFRRLDASGAVIVLGEAAAAGCDDRLRESMTRRRTAVMVVGAGAIGGRSLATGLLADWYGVAEGSTIELEGPPEEGSAVRADIVTGLLRRIPNRVISLLLSGESTLDAPVAERLGIVDALVPGDGDSLEWVAGLLAGRSLPAFQSAAALTRYRGGDGLERAEFARLFATGEPGRGMQQFLSKRRPDFSEAVQVERI